MKVKKIRWRDTITYGSESFLSFGVTADVVRNYQDPPQFNYRIYTRDTYIEGFCDTLELAKEEVQELWEKLVMEAVEENKGCEYCLAPVMPLIYGVWEDKGLKSFLETGIDGNSLYTSADIRSEYREGEKKISYCPMCGRGLKESGNE